MIIINIPLPPSYTDLNRWQIWIIFSAMYWFKNKNKTSWVNTPVPSLHEFSLGKDLTIVLWTIDINYICIWCPFCIFRFVKICNMSDIFGNDSTGSMDMLVDISSATTPQETVSLTFNNDLPQFKTSSKYFVSELNKFVKVLKNLNFM